jgi:hypothetical protein
MLLLSLALALLTGAITAWCAAHADHLDREHLASLINVPGPWTSEAWLWLQTRADRRLATLQAVLRLTLLVTAIVSLGWIMGVGLVVVSYVAGVIVGSRRAQPVMQVGYSLERAASIVRANAQMLHATGDGDQARAAGEYAARIDFLRDIYGRLAPIVFAQLEMPADLALTLELYYLPLTLVAADSEMPADERRESPPRTRGDLHYGFPNWLYSEIRPLLTHPYEQSRVDCLERVRQEILAGGGTAYQDLGRIQQIVAELRRTA